MITQMLLRGVRSPEGALGLLRALGYDTDAARPYDLTDVGLTGTGIRLRTHQTRGHGVLVAEVEAMPRSLKTIGRRLLDRFHDEPLCILGVRGGHTWDTFVVVRPRLVRGGGGAVTITRLVVRPSLPTAHDVEVIARLEWRADRSDAENQLAIDQALDVERVTRRFFIELNSHYLDIVKEVDACAESTAALRAAVERAGGAERVALRVVTQTLFTYFLQRKGLLGGQPAWLTHRFAQQAHNGGGFYAAVMEPLFYAALALPVDERSAEWQAADVPFLNGGLFDRRYGDVSLPLPDALFSTEDGLLGFLDSWSFTVAEERADETEVAVDPEMLGKVFENLMAEDDRRDQGAIYTPRPVVQFMCREALVPFLQRSVDVTEREARALIDGDEPFEQLSEAATPERAAEVADRLDLALAAITVLDPAVGSGAFLLGMLAEIVRLRRHAHRLTAGSEPTDAEMHAWRLQAIESSLFGVDINPAAIELCRLRLWLALLVDTPEGQDPEPLPNLEFRTIAANSLTDFVAGVEVQNTRDGVQALDIHELDLDAVVQLRQRYFSTSEPTAKAAVRQEIEEAEDALLTRIFGRARESATAVAAAPATHAAGEQALGDISRLEMAFHGRDRVFPAFMPAFHTPEVREGWDVVIMNPPYLSRKEVRQRLDDVQLADLERHYGRTSDLMIHFAWRALELVREGGVLSMIFNDSIFTSTDAADLRCRLLASDEAPETIHVAARTRCFEGVAVNGGVVVATTGLGHDSELRWVENHGRPVEDLLAAGRIADPSRTFTPIGASELFEVSSRNFLKLPHRPLFRPSPPARELVKRFAQCAGWEQFGRYEANGGGGSWQLLSNTRGLERWIAAAQQEGFYDGLRPGEDWVLLGLMIEGGQGLATADDRRFLAALDGSDEALEVPGRRADLAARLDAHPAARSRYREVLAAGGTEEAALLDVADQWHPVRDLGWPKSGLVRTAPADGVRHVRLTDEEVQHGVADGPSWVPFEKGDSSGQDGGASKWTRQNPIVIDWSRDAVELLRTRAVGGDSYRRPRLQNQQLWGKGGVAFNRVASYMRARRVPVGAIFSDKAPTIGSRAPWLPTEALLAILNSPPVDFLLRTFLGSRNQIEIGDLRALPVPVFSNDTSVTLSDLGRRAMNAKSALDADEEGEPLADIEAELDAFARDLYGIPAQADLWVVR